MAKKANDDEPVIYTCQDCGFETDDAAEAENHNEDTGHCMDDGQ